jgi:vacuolar-type H+-ATPase subunit I/STV1
METKKRLSKRISDLQVDMRELRRGYQNLLDERANTAKEIRQIFTSELAVYRSAVQATQTDRIKFGVLEEWIREVFELNGLKFSDQDFIEKSEEQMLREKIAQEIEAAVTQQKQ